MAINQQQQDNLYKGLGLFIEAFRPYVVSKLMKEAGDKWSAWFVEALYPAQRETWNLGIKQGTSPEALIDYPYLKSFVLKYKDFLKADFGKDLNKLATRLDTIYDTRNKLAHFQAITSDDFAETYIQMKSISRSLKMDELEKELSVLQEAKVHTAPATKNKANSDSLQPWFTVFTPHVGILGTGD